MLLFNFDFFVFLRINYEFICVRNKMTKRGEAEAKIPHMLGHSPSDYHGQMSQAEAKSRNSFQVFHVGSRGLGLGPLPGSWTGGRAAGTQVSTPPWKTGVANW